MVLGQRTAIAGGRIRVPENGRKLLKKQLQAAVDGLENRLHRIGFIRAALDGCDAVVPVGEHEGGNQRFLGREVVVYGSDTDSAGLGDGADGHGAETGFFDLTAGLFGKPLGEIFDDLRHSSSFVNTFT